MPVELGLGRGKCGVEVVVESRVDDLVAVIFQVGRLDAAWNRVPAVEEQDSSILALVGTDADAADVVVPE